MRSVILHYARLFAMSRDGWFAVVGVSDVVAALAYFTVEHIAIGKWSTCAASRECKRTVRERMQNSDENLLGHCRSIAKLTIFVRTRGPETAVFF